MPTWAWFLVGMVIGGVFCGTVAFLATVIKLNPFKNW